MLRLNYENDLLSEQSYLASVRTTFEYLGLPATPVASKFIKLGAGSLDRRIENYDEIARVAERLGVTPTR